jgi:gas vesicle protein
LVVLIENENKGVSMKQADFAKGALIGLIAGAIGGVLLAPKSGKDLRKDLRDNFDEMKTKVTDKLEKAGEFTKDTYDEAVSRVVSGYEEAKKITPDDAKEIKKIFEKSYADIEKIVKKDAKKIKKAASR